jgi:large subunit ribosomal protein L17
MRHRKAGRRLGRNSSHQQAMMRNMVTSLLQHERIVTTAPKAKELRRLADKMISLAKRGDLHARRQALAVIRSRKVVDKLFTEIKDEYMDRNGGYTRIIRTGNRTGDAASMAIIELVNYTETPEPATN